MCGVVRQMEAGAGIEPAIEVLQTSALPLGDPALNHTVKLLSAAERVNLASQTQSTLAFGAAMVTGGGPAGAAGGGGGSAEGGGAGGLGGGVN